MPIDPETPRAPAPCPVCRAQGVEVLGLTAAHIRAQVAGIFGVPVPGGVAIADYVMRECVSCGLVYADPMLSGGADYYGWITAQPKYHAGRRWEWGVIRADLARRAEPLTVLEVGCGDGKLMAFLAQTGGIAMTGVDVSAPSVDKARAQGFDVRLAAFEHLDQVLSPGETFDAVLLSHVLEHVADPLGVMRQAAARLKPGGAVYAALPYSPMSRELAGWDIQNLPPHHLTRWNQRSLSKLAGVLGLGLDLRLPKAKSPFKRAVRETCGQVLGGKHPAPWTRAWVVLTHPRMFLDWCARFAARERVNGRPAGDSVLARFVKS